MEINVNKVNWISFLSVSWLSNFYQTQNSSLCNCFDKNKNICLNKYRIINLYLIKTNFIKFFIIMSHHDKIAKSCNLSKRKNFKILMFIFIFIPTDLYMVI